MPRTELQANPSPARLAAPSFTARVVAAYLLACLPLLAWRHFDPSVFVIAGDRYVNAAGTNPPLRVKPRSDGYDGQFYYRLAVAPLATAIRADGITFDHPAKRTQRILYPLLAWALSLGHAAAAAWALFAINLGAVGVVAWIACRLARQLALPAAAPLAIVLWPGFIVAILHDTSEIVAAAFLLAALSARLSGRLVLYAALAAAAVLTRETTLAPLIGLLALALRHPRAWRPVLACAVPLLVFLAWRQALSVLLHEAPQAQGAAHDLGWPMAGAARMLWDCVTGGRSWASSPLKDAVFRAYVLASALPLLVFCGVVAWRLRGRDMGPVASGWVASAGLMSLLAATGPWIDPVAYLRAFTECFVLGSLLVPPPARWMVAQAAMAWVFCLIQLR